VLVHRATAGFRHGSISNGKCALEQLGEHTGAFEAAISDGLSNSEMQPSELFDVVVILNSTGDFCAESEGLPS